MPRDDADSASATAVTAAELRALGKREHIARLSVALHAVAPLAYDRISETHLGQPGEESQFQADITTVGDKTAGVVQQVCSMWHLAAAQTLQAVGSCYQDGLELFAPGPLLRASIEHSARICWVLDAPSGRQRAARGWLARVVANAEDAHTHKNSGNPTETFAGAPDRVEQLCTVTLPDLFSGEHPDRRGRSNPRDWIFIGQKWGDNTTCVEHFFKQYVQPRWGERLDGRVEYRVASMFAHPSTTAAFAQATVEADGATITPSWTLIRVRSLVAIVAFESATRVLYGYLGWQSSALDAWTTKVEQIIAETPA